MTSRPARDKQHTVERWSMCIGRPSQMVATQSLLPLLSLLSVGMQSLVCG